MAFWFSSEQGWDMYAESPGFFSERELTTLNWSCTLETLKIIIQQHKNDKSSFLLGNKEENKTTSIWQHTTGDTVDTMWHLIINPSGDSESDTPWADLHIHRQNECFCFHLMWTEMPWNVCLHLDYNDSFKQSSQALISCINSCKQSFALIMLLSKCKKKKKGIF